MRLEYRVISIPLFLSQEHDCGYLENHLEQSAFVHPDTELSIPIYSQLLANGFRRSGDLVYKPLCKQCSACISVRIPIADFKPSRSQKRVLKNQSIIDITIKSASFHQAHYDLYLKYQQHRHKGGGMAQSSPEEYFNFLSSTWCNTLFVEMTIDKTLVAVAIIDQLNDALSAVYTFFDPDYSRYGLGNFAVLWQIQYARQLNLPWLYLGYWIKQCRKMSYKNQYRPIQAFINEEWRYFDKDEEIELP